MQHLPDGAVVQRWGQDDTLPNNPYLQERRWVAPCTRASREDDYRIAWAFFAAQAAVQTSARGLDAHFRGHDVLVASTYETDI